MHPWTFLWAPQFYFPWSGSVTQHNDPKTNWFSEHIDRKAGDPAIEEKAFEIATYGKQLGIISEVLIDLAEQSELTSDKAKTSLSRLKDISAAIEQVKQAENQVLLESLLENAATLKNRDPEKFKALQQVLSGDLIEQTPKALG